MDLGELSGQLKGAVVEIRGGDQRRPLHVINDQIRRRENLPRLIQAMRYWHGKPRGAEELQQFEFIGCRSRIPLEGTLSRLAYNPSFRSTTGLLDLQRRHLGRESS